MNIQNFILKLKAVLPGLELKIRKYFILILTVVFLLWLAYFLFVGSLFRFYEGAKTVQIEKGSSAKQVGAVLKKEGVVASSQLFTLLIVLFDSEDSIVSGPYYFERREGLLNVIRRITTGDFQTRSLSVTFPEGFTVRQIAERLRAQIKGFNADAFYDLAKDKEGYLFPETYYFMPDVTPEEVLNSFEFEFNKNIEKVSDRLYDSKKKLEEVIIMASILEREVRSLEDKKLVAGILYKRISIGMPLQVDATFAYERGKGSYDLSTADLRKDSPYNTYTNKGLPPGPISNPGLDSIEAAIEPEENPYLYFLTDRAGIVHYARTHEEHVRNKALYI